MCESISHMAGWRLATYIFTYSLMFLFCLKDNPYIRFEMDEQTGTTNYYLDPCDTFNAQGRQTADGYEEALPTPRPAETPTK